MSEIKVNKISPRTACGTTTLGDSGDTFTLPSGTTMTVASGATITNSGTASGFGATGETSWDTTVKTTGTFTATAGVGYFLNTTGGVITVNLPAGAAGSSVALADYAGTWQTSNVTVSPNGAEKMGGVNADITLSTQGQAVTFVYIDGTQGWVNVLDSTSNVRGATFVAATGGNVIVTNGDYKTHIFTGPGTFTVSSTSSTPADNKVDYFVVAGGGGGFGGGGGAGGFRAFSTAPGSNSPLNNSGASPNTEITVSATGYPITVGSGGAGTPASSPVYCAPAAVAGTVSTFSTVTSAGGGRAGAYAPSGGTPAGTGGNGGSGGGGGYLQSGGASMPGGTGNTPPVSPPQGQNGGTGQHVPGVWGAAGGGGGAGAVGTNATPGPGASIGGAGSYIADSFVGPTAPSYGTPGPVSSTRYFAGGGSAGPAAASAGGGGVNNGNGTANTGGGAGGGTPSGSGGSGIVMIRYKFQ